ncbi:MAG TPA: DTW domain-containing protein [Rhodospirillaceae bacterium]|nr:DTW domain-containing protein [Rhodospirillaceae bacterium]
MTEPLPADCAICQKPAELCVCAETEKIDNRIEVLILQHPQEQDKTLGTARLLAHQLSRAQLKVGLSWPSLAKALGRDAEPRRWAVLYLGSAKAAPGREVEVQDAKGAVIADQDRGMAGIEGVVVLDGTWSQAKALWWRNPWVLKCKRIVLAPTHPSAYGRLRREPRREGLSTIEAVGLLLGRLERRPEIDAALFAGFRRMLERFRQSSHCRPAGQTEKKKDRRRHSA